ncbi:MAG: hypothetical protein H0W08_22595 [Acidobacteria bacterium]|nr:hypothetical protein [Acidobacteriota bacterium]
MLVGFDQLVPRGLHPALADPGPLLGWLAAGAADGLVLHAGIAVQYSGRLAGGCPWLMKLTTNSALASDSTVRGRIGSVEQALALGASGVALNVFIASRHEAAQLARLADAVASGARWGIPVVAFMSSPQQLQFDPDAVAYACRIGAEIGADVIKTDFTGDPRTFASVVKQCPVPVIVEESPLPMTPEGTLATARDAMAAGAAGVLFGSRIWAEPDARVLVSGLRRVVHESHEPPPIH